MLEMTVFLIGAMILVIAVSVGISRWVFRINDIVMAMRETRDIMRETSGSINAARQHLARIDYFLNPANKTGRQ